MGKLAMVISAKAVIDVIRTFQDKDFIPQDGEVVRIDSDGVNLVFKIVIESAMYDELPNGNPIPEIFPIVSTYGAVALISKTCPSCLKGTLINKTTDVGTTEWNCDSCGKVFTNTIQEKVIVPPSRPNYPI